MNTMLSPNTIKHEMRAQITLHIVWRHRYRKVIKIVTFFLFATCCSICTLLLLSRIEIVNTESGSERYVTGKLRLITFQFQIHYL